MTIVYPSGEAPPHAMYHVRKGDLPMVSLVSPNHQIILWLMGGLAMADPMAPESVQVTSISGLMAPWEFIDQQGATQDGVSFVDALYGPTDINVDVLLTARDAKHLRQLRRHLQECLDAHKQSEFGWATPEMGYWWAPIRWGKTDMTPERVGQENVSQKMTLRLRGDNAFYQSWPDIDSFEFLYEDMTDTFNVDYTDERNVGPNWPMLYSGNGVGFLYANGDNARWQDDPDSVFFTGTKRVICGPFKDYATTDDEQEISFVVNNTPEFTVGSGAAMDLWGRMGRDEDGLWDGNGIRARFGYGYLSISAFVNFVEHQLTFTLTLFPPLAGQTLKLKCLAGQRKFEIWADALKIWEVTDTAAISHMGADYRGVGFGLQGGAAIITQATPGDIRSVTANSTLLDTFGTDIPDGLGVNWPLRYEGFNDAYVRAQGGNAQWVDNSGTETQVVICGPYKDFDTETDCQVVSMVLGSYPEWSAPATGANDLWGRMGHNPDGTWDGNGIRLRASYNEIILTAFVDFDEVWTRTVGNWVTPFPGDKWTMVCGYTDDPRMFKVQRNGAIVLSYKESGTASMIGADYRGIGFGVRAGGAWITQATPAIVRKISAGDNAEVTQTGYLKQCNAGDQDAYDEYTFYGPGTVGIENGAGSGEMVTLGKLAVGEIAHIRTDPRKQGVFDYTNRTGEETASILFGASPTDQMYAKMKGRFTKACVVPGKEPGMRVTTRKLKVQITGGNADSMIQRQLTPLRRYPQ